MTVIIASKDNRPRAEEQAESHTNTVIVSPQHRRAIHGAEKVILIGSYPHLEKRYRGICPIQIIPTHDGQPDISDD